MQYFLPIFNQMIVLLIFIAVGVILSRKKIVPDNAATVLSKLENTVFVPALVLGTFIKNCTVDVLSQVWQLVVVSFVLALAFIPVSKWLAKKFVKEEFMQKLAGYGLIFSNFGFMGNAIFLSVFPDIFFEYTLFTLPLWTMAYVWGVPTILIPKEAQATTLKDKLKPFLNPMLIAVLIGAVIGLTGLGAYVPSPVTQAVDSVAACMTPVAMILTGIVVGNIDWLAMLKKAYLYVISALRLIVYPAVVLGIIALLTLLPANPFCTDTVYKCALCAMAMPMGLTSIFVPAAYGKDVSEAAGLVLFTHVLSVITVPLMFMGLQMIIGG